MPLIFSNLLSLLHKEIFWDLVTANYDKGRCYYKNPKKIGENSQLGLTSPPPLRDNSEFFESQNCFKNADPPSDQFYIF